MELAGDGAPVGLQDSAESIQTDWLRAMRAGDFESAWRASDRALALGASRNPELPRHFQNVWDGRPLDGKRVLVRCYHGLGDTIQFARFLPQLESVAREVVVWAQPELLPLLGHLCNWHGQLLPLHDGSPQTEYDVDLEIMELPHVFHTTLATLPRQVRYFDLAGEQPKPGALRVGIVCEAGGWDQTRSIPRELLLPLADLDDVEVHWLQPGSTPPGCIDGSCTEILGLARRMLGLDLVISVDTMAAHLAGALGRPTWTLLRAEADWRWMEERTDSPWYPTMRLFRPERGDGWTGIAERVRRAVARLGISEPLPKEVSPQTH